MKLHYPAVELRDGRLLFTDRAKANILAMVGELAAPFLQVTIQEPFRPRTVGKGSQNHRVNGFIQQIAAETGEDFDDLKIRMKQRAISRGWPFVTMEEWINGVLHEYRVAKSESKASVKECGMLIETIEQYAAEAGIVLREGE